MLEEERKPEATEIKIREPSDRPIKGEPAPADTKKSGCAHHFGYLSKRSTKEKIPEECIVCENIVQCMLKNVTG